VAVVGDGVNDAYWLAVSTDLAGGLMIIVGRLGPLIRGAIHVLHSLGILLNSSRLLSWKPPEKKSVTHF
jgi:cation-transporting P-type ATPase C